MALDIKVSKRQLSLAEAEIIAREITLTPNIIGYRPAELMRLTNMLVIEDNDGLIGVLAYQESRRFIDFKLFIVRQKFRGKGCGQKLFDDFMKRVGNSPKPIYTVTKNPAVIHMLEEAGFRRVRLTTLPPAAILHQAKMAFSAYRIKEFIRKAIKLPSSTKFSYWLKEL